MLPSFAISPRKFDKAKLAHFCRRNTSQNLYCHPSLIIMRGQSVDQVIKRIIGKSTSVIFFDLVLVVIGELNEYHLILRVLFSCFKPPTVITSLARSLASVITVGGLKHENNTLRIRLYSFNSPITTEQGVNTTSFLHPYFPILNHPAFKKRRKF